ncbi:hypothetical protein [Aquibacillus saliphilus]|uniref:hypothetical protein n=1 Tax=Aquibacillus saliphilus TaxID=1909422 RepID=UPI001CEFF706|nr:hypothetical protein [Aquibacillus saliphilus]
MKRLLSFSILILLITILAACTDKSGTPIETNENKMILTINNNANFDFYSMEVVTSGSTSGMVNADGSKLEKGNSLRFEYIDEVDVELEGEASFEFVLVGKKQTNRVPLETFTIELAPNMEYFFEITGDSIEEADLKRVN